MALAPQETVFITLYKLLNDSSVYLDLAAQDNVCRLARQLISGNDQAVKESRDYLLSLQERRFPFIAAYYAARNFSISSLTLKNAADILLPFAALVAGTLAHRDPFNPADNSVKALILELLILTFLALYACYQFYALGKHLLYLAQNRHEVLKDLISFTKNSTRVMTDEICNFALAFFGTNPPRRPGLVLDVTPLIVNNIQQLESHELLSLYRRIFPADVLQLDNVPQLR